MAVDTVRHIKVFDPDMFGTRRIDCIGAGAIGSRVVLGLAKLGIQNIHVWDYDTVESHNIANQIFGNDDVGKLKVDAIAELVKRQTGTVITTYPTKVEGGEQLGSIVFLMPDTMAARKAIWDKSLKYRPSTQLMVEIRMGADTGRVYVINPSDPTEIDYWEKSSAYTDAEAEVSACGATTSVGATADVLSGIAVWQLMRWFNFSTAVPEAIAHEPCTVVALRPSVLLAGVI